MVKVMFAFSGDPIQYGHLDVIQRAAARFEEVVVGIGINPNKKYLFSLDERLEMTKKALTAIENVSVVSYEGLLVDYAYEHRINTIIKGVRNGKDLEYELDLHHLGETQQCDIDTFFLPSRKEYMNLSSTSVKDLQKDHGFIYAFVPLHVKQGLEAKISGQYIIGVTGEIGAGKSYLSNKLVEIGKQNNIAVRNIELDHIGHSLLHELTAPLYLQLREQIISTFGEIVRLPNNEINRKVLGELVFDDPKSLHQLNQLMQRPLLTRLRIELSRPNPQESEKEIILLNAALLAESYLTPHCNNNVILVTTDKETQEARLHDRDLDNGQIERRLASQYQTDEKSRRINEQIIKHNHGKLWEVQNSSTTPVDVEQLFQEIITYFKIK